MYSLIVELLSLGLLHSAGLVRLPLNSFSPRNTRTSPSWPCSGSNPYPIATSMTVSRNFRATRLPCRETAELGTSELPAIRSEAAFAGVLWLSEGNSHAHEEVGPTVASAFDAAHRHVSITSWRLKATLSRSGHHLPGFPAG